MSIARAVLAVLVLAPAMAFGQVSKWDLDTAHTAAGFTISHLLVAKVRGAFANVTGTVTLDEKDVTKSSVEVSIDATTIDTRTPKRDEHLRSADFFDVAKYPAITFKSTKVEKAKEGLKVTGDLTMHGVTKTVVLDVKGPTPEIKDPWGKARRGASASTKINRQDYGISGGVPAVGNEVAIEIETELVKQEALKAEPAKAEPAKK